MPDTVRVIISDEPPGSEFADTVPVERVKPCPLTVATSTSSLYVMVMVSAESTEAAVIRGGGAMLFATAAATKLAREFGWDAVSSMQAGTFGICQTNDIITIKCVTKGEGNYIIIGCNCINSWVCSDVTGQHKVSGSCRVYCNLLR